MKFVFINTILLVLIASEAFRLPASHLHKLEDDEPEEPVEPVTRRTVSRATTSTVTFTSVIADLNQVIDDLGELEEDMDGLQTDYDKCKADLADCEGSSQPACPGVENLVDLKAAISGASSGTTPTTIILCPSTIKPSSPIAIENKNVVLSCNGPGSCIFDGDNASGLFSITQGSTVVFDDIKFKDGKASRGGALNVYRAAKVDLIDCDFTGNNATQHGGAVYLYELTSKVTVESCTFSSNGAGDTGGAVLVKDSTLDIKDTSFTANTAEWGGAMSVFNDSIVDVQRQVNDPKFSANVATEGGGAVYARDSKLTFDGTEFIGNEADEGAGLRLLDADVEIADSVFSGNKDTRSGSNEGFDLYIWKGGFVDCDSTNRVYFCNGRLNGIHNEVGDNTDCDTVGRDDVAGSPCP